MPSSRPCLLVGGAPRLPVDAVRHLTVRATGATAVALAIRLRQLGIDAGLLLSADAAAAPQALRYADRDGLEEHLGRWIARHPDGCVVMSAAVNDYRVAAVERIEDGEVRRIHPGEKIASGADEVVIRLRPADKLIDRLRREFGLRGPIVGFKLEDSRTVLASAEALRRRTGAALVVANSICGGVQALVDADGTVALPDREALLTELAERISVL
jgi:phosphopantothenate-cysteine ligase/phosphopantothenoylcysteine decarboxylase/phosphopantothenate--cysteine ligase